LDEFSSKERQWEQTPFSSKVIKGSELSITQRTQTVISTETYLSFLNDFGTTPVFG
jgi:hypothetical protein